MSYDPYNLQPGDTGIKGYVYQCGFIPVAELFSGTVGAIDATDAYTRGNPGAIICIFSQAFQRGDPVTFDYTETENGARVAVNVAADDSRPWLDLSLQF